MGDTGTKPKRTFLVGPGPPPPTSQTRKNNKNTIVSAPLNPTVSSSAAAPIETVRNLEKEEGKATVEVASTSASIKGTPVPIFKKTYLKNPVTVKDTLINGDCFYSSLFRAAQEQSLLTIIHTCHSTIIISDEPSFISSFRNLVADEIIADRLPSIKGKNGNVNVYDTLATGSAEETSNSTVYKKILEGFPEWFATDFKTQLGTREFFLNFYAAGARKMENWVGEIEVRIVKQLLEPCKIKLNILNHVVNKLSKKDGEYEIINLINYGESHYKYFSFEVPVGLPSLKTTGPLEPPVSSLGKVKNDCEELFDPCTKEPIANLEALEKRVRELKRQANTTPIGLYDLTTNTTNYDFLTNVFVNKDITLDDMVSFKLAEGRTRGADIFEVLSRLFVFFGGIKMVNPRDGGNYKFKKMAEGSLIYENPKLAFQDMKCVAARGSGISDITLINVRNDKKPIKEDDPYCEVPCETVSTDNIKTYVMSVKWYREEKSAEHYDLEKLYTLTNTQITSPEQRPTGIIVFLKSKRDFQIAHNRAFRQYTSDLADTFFGWEEDVKPFLEEVRRTIFDLANQKGIIPKEALDSQYFVTGAKPILSLQLHQDIIVKGVCNAIQHSQDNLYLIGVLPRGGKTFIAGGIIREFLNRSKITSLTVFWLTAAPNETLTQVKNDLVHKFQDFDMFDFIEARDVKDVQIKSPYTIVFCSSQLLLQSQKRSSSASSSKRIYLEDMIKGRDKFGLVFFDEAHKTGTGTETKAQIDNIISKYYGSTLPLIFLTATYYNILFDYQIQKHNTFVWDYTDVLATRALATISEQESAIDNLRNRFGKDLVDSVIVKRLANNESYEAMAKAYTEFPDLYFLSCHFNEEAIERFTVQDQYRPDSGFSLGSIFAIRTGTDVTHIKTADNKIKTDAFRIFENLDNPRNMISLITPTGTFDEPGASGTPLTKEEGSSIEPSILGRINNMSRDSNSRFRLDERPTLLMFMPVGGEGSNIFYLLCAWASLLMNHSWWKERYEVACVVTEEALTSSHVSSLIGTISESSTNIHIINKNPKASIMKLERTLHCGEKKKGLVILAGEKLSMGISLPCTDVVFLLNEKKTPDDIIQKMYRALTPSPGKKSAYVVDLNPVRTLAAIYGYTRASHEESNTKSELLGIIYDTYTWDADVYDYNLSKGADSRLPKFQERLQVLFEKAEMDKEYKINEDIGGFEKKLAENIRKGLDPEFISKIMGAFNGKKIESVLPSIGLKEGSSVSIDKTGKLIIKSKVPNPPQSSSEEGKEDEEDEFNTVEIKINNFIETLTDFVKYLAITSTKPTLDEALVDYETKTPNSEGTVLQSNVIKLVRARTVIEGIISDDILSNLFVTAIKNFGHHSSVMVYRQMKSKVDEKSVRKNAVLKIIHEHLTPKRKEKAEKGEVFTPVELIESMLSHLPVSTWKNPDLKFLDPANGIGNFPVVAFYKLDEGLKGWELDEDKRRRHIINNMLYMLEIQSNNTRIARNLFQKLCTGSKPNILTLNSVEEDKYKKFILPLKLKSKGFPEKYDIIMGNPPFNAGGLLKGGGTLWPKFVKLAFELINTNGHITFVHPPGWRKFYDPEDRENQGKLWFDIREKGWNLDYINISDQPPKHFPIVDYYVIHAKESEALTKYDSTFMGISGEGESKLDLPFIPNMLNKETLSILKKLFEAKGEPIHIVYNQEFKPSVSDKGKSGISHYHFTSRTGEKQIYKKNYVSIPEYITRDKVILTAKAGYEKGKLFAFYSDEQLGTTNNSMYMLTTSKTQAEKLVKFFNSDIITFLMKITQYSAPPNHINEFKILNQLEVPESMDIYHLTEKEITLIKKVVGAKEEVSSGETKGGSRKSIGKTRKLKRN